MTREQILAAIRARYNAYDLDSHVIELKKCEASDINSAGFDAQLEYLEKAGGIDWLAQALLYEYA